MEKGGSTKSKLKRKVITFKEVTYNKILREAKTYLRIIPIFIFFTATVVSLMILVRLKFISSFNANVRSRELKEKVLVKPPRMQSK